MSQLFKKYPELSFVPELGHVQPEVKCQQLSGSTRKQQ